MAQTQKLMSDRDYQQTLKFAYNDVDATLTVNGFLVGKVGRKVVQTISTTTVLNDTLTFDFQENSVSLYQLQIIYTDNTYNTMISAERIS